MSKKSFLKELILFLVVVFTSFSDSYGQSELFTTDTIQFKNHIDSIKLEGSLTLPKGIENPNLVILITGSGAQNRDSEILGLKPFKELSDHLSSNGVAVFRFDERGVGNSEGNFAKATSFHLSTDVEAAFNYFSEGDYQFNAIGLLGHSEGGMIAPMIAARNPNVEFIVSLAGPGVPIVDLMVDQNAQVLRTNGMSEAGIQIVKENLGDIFRMYASDIPMEEKKDTIFTNVKRYYSLFDETDKSIIAPSADMYHLGLGMAFNQPWFKFFIGYDPTEDWKSVQCPVLALNGTKDIQVSSTMNLPAIEKNLSEGKNEDVTIMPLEGLNHLFQKCTICDVKEYTTIDHTFEQEVLEIIQKFISRQ